MSRGSECRDFDEKVAVYAIGEAINHITLDHMRDPLYAGWDYEQCAGAAGEELGFALANMVKQYLAPKTPKP